MRFQSAVGFHIDFPGLDGHHVRIFPMPAILSHCKMEKIPAAVHREDILTGHWQQEDAPAVSQSQTLHRPLEETTVVQELPPADHGRKAWMFCASAFLLDLMIFGYSTSYGIFQIYYTTHPPFENTSSVGITATGTICIGLMYGEAILVSLAAGRYPDYVKPAMWVGLGLFCLSLLASSFATKVWQLILFQGIGVGVGGGLLYWPIALYLPQWFVVRQGLASGLIFSGSGAGGFLFPLLLDVMLEHIGVQWALRIWTLATTILSGIALLGVNPRLPVPRYTSEHRRPRVIPPQLDFLKSTLFWAFVALSFFPVSLYIASFATLVSSPLSATIVFSTFNVASDIGQVTRCSLDTCATASLTRGSCSSARSEAALPHSFSGASESRTPSRASSPLPSSSGV
ncbi:major facilitator superfamily domain-containing protein [Amylocystis lapponica]|nr:major facilitator superfamily domain-containing protein [Amylocystis lapponica]